MNSNLKKALRLAALIAMAGVLTAAAPPSTAPNTNVNAGLQPVAIYDASGNIVSSFGGGGSGSTGSVTAAGTNGTAAQAIQGINGGVNVGVSAASWPLPTGAATAAAQATGNASLSSIDTKVPALVSGRTPVDGSGVTQPISAASLPLPSGAATAANQATQTTALGAVGDTAYAGTGNASANATDFVGQITTGASVVSGCMVTFSKLYANLGCLAQSNSSASAVAGAPVMGTAGGKTTMTVNLTLALSAGRVTYFCAPV